MKKTTLGILTLVMFAVLIVPAVVPAAAQGVYFVPQHSSAKYCDSVPVEIWATATNFKSGQINMSYNPSCANVTN